MDNGKWLKGTILWPLNDALLVANGFKQDHPTWLVELNPVETKEL